MMDKTMDNEVKNRLDEQDKMLSQIYKSVEKTRKYFLIIFWITIVMVGLPVIGLMFAIPAFLSSYNSILGL
jgi:predicted AlkP superfamily pyrophosphatase or phosphodiesterase